MAIPPLSHHDIVKRTAPMSKNGHKVNLARCDRQKHYIEFTATTESSLASHVVHCIELDQDENSFLVRALVHESGLVSLLRIKYRDLDHALRQLNMIPAEQQIILGNDYAVACSFTLTSSVEVQHALSALQLQFFCANVAGLQIRADISASGGMPADVRLLNIDAPLPDLPSSLADDTTVPMLHQVSASFKQHPVTSNTKGSSTNSSNGKLPDDLLAVLGAQWRPLRNQGDHWKCILRQLGTGQKRSTLAQKYLLGAVHHLEDTLQQDASSYHSNHSIARWKVYFRRLYPLMLLGGMVASMPAIWLLVSNGTIGINPLAMGSAPLLMVCAIVLTWREIPVLEIPATPRGLDNSFWQRSTSLTDNSATNLREQQP